MAFVILLAACGTPESPVNPAEPADVTPSLHATAGEVIIHVDDDATPGGNGSGRYPYHNLPEAVAAATFVISDRDGTLAGAWIDHPASDPFLGPCPGDAAHEPLQNTLIYNGVALLEGRNF